MNRWEYLLVELPEPLQREAIAILNKYGAEGWEAYGTTRLESTSTATKKAWTTIHMKRVVTPSESQAVKT